ncbi:BQ5605_C007g04649 [Microbotryum silenes-dioicae]|uniref:BQ5605_C007g04649 protein n=1 Tax=Microbotryum silenes-dioicae TaxID=796604 RepID=A0A2X0MUR7_9BASI|nr:BQ5605_C007g04649 [Microbotryum silenes-dioicae]
MVTQQIGFANGLCGKACGAGRAILGEGERERRSESRPEGIEASWAEARFARDQHSCLRDANIVFFFFFFFDQLLIRDVAVVVLDGAGDRRERLMAQQRSAAKTGRRRDTSRLVVRAWI